MNPKKVKRDQVQTLVDLPNVGEAIAEDLQLLGVHDPSQLSGMCPYEMYFQMCEISGIRQDPCLLDVFISITRFMEGDEPRPWWDYSKERKSMLKVKVDGSE